MDLEVEAATFMDVYLYKAAVDGKIEAFNDYEGRLDRLVTPNQNTVLHVHLANRWRKYKVYQFVLIFFTTRRTPTLSSTKFVEQLLIKCPLLLLQANIKGEIPLHIEAMHGHCPTVKLLLERAKVAQQEDLEKGLEATKEMLKMTENEQLNTPLHIAARYGHLEVARALIEADPDFVYSANRKGETPLYIAARRGYNDLVAEMLNKCKSVAHAGPKGTTALHAAVMAGDRATVGTILKKKKNLTKETDDDGRSPLHFAAHLGRHPIAIQLLECDKSAAYLVDSEGKMTALHMAARQGHALVMKDIIQHCPDCCELVDERGWNFLHFAAIISLRSSLHFFADDIDIGYASMGNALVQKDIYGNTPIHVLAASRPLHYRIAMRYEKDKVKPSTIEGLTKKKKDKILDIVKVVRSGEVAGEPVKHWYLGSMIPPEFEKARDSHVVVPALIATVTFTAAFTVPGGFINEKGPDQGTAVLIRKPIFIAFAVCNAISLVSSLFSVFVHFLMARPYSLKSYNMYMYAYLSTLLAVGAMVAAFLFGTFAVFDTSLGLALTIFFIGLSFPLLAFSFGFPLNLYEFLG